MSTAQVRSVYRQLWRAACTTLSGDAPALSAAKTEIRSHFVKHAAVTDAQEIQALCAGGSEAAEFLRQSVVQGRLNSRGNYVISKVPPQEELHFREPSVVAKSLEDGEASTQGKA